MHEQFAVSNMQMLPDGWQRELKSVSREQPAHSQISGLCSRSLSSWAHRNGHFGTEDASSLPSLIPLPEPCVLWRPGTGGIQKANRKEEGDRAKRKGGNCMPSSTKCALLEGARSVK